MIEAVVFDGDGVLTFKLRFAWFLATQHRITPQTTRPFFRGPFERCLVGEANLKEVLPPFLAAWGWAGTADAFVDLWLEKDDAVDERMVGVVRALRKAGFTCCLATNQERHRAGYMRRNMGFGELFDHLFFSCEIGATKPDPVFFREIEGTLGVAAEGILFLDDDPQNVDAARARGWRAEVYVVFQEFLRDLSLYLAT
jgi:putative hydrolase of the HAD superfamily